MKIYLAQLTHQNGDFLQNSHFPLAIGFIAGYLKKNLKKIEEIQLFKSPYELNNALISSLPDVLILSNYLWNTNITLQFAKKVKEANPNILIIMGGPNFPLDAKKRIDFLKENTFIDFYVLNEGELVCADIVQKFEDCKDINILKAQNIPSTVSVLGNKEYYSEPSENQRIGVEDFSVQYDDIPSPYLTGLFDKFFVDGLIPLIETNRGCPFTCAFCQQGEKYCSKIVFFSLDRIIEELELIGQKIKERDLKMYILEISDSNFAMYKRDKEITKAIRKIQDKYGYPLDISSSTGKNKTELIIDNLAELKDGTSSIRIAVQSLNEDTLSAIRRKNINISGYKTVQEYQSKRGIRSLADVMLGLPLETLESHSQSIYDLIDWGIDEFALLQTIVLPGTELEKSDYRVKHGIKTMFRPIPECFEKYNILNHSIQICETEEIIVETNTMSHNDYFEARKLHLLTMIFHNTNLCSPIYRVFNMLNINRSVLIKTIFYNSTDIKDLLNDFIRDTKNELFNNPKDIYKQENLEQYTYNKIFKHLAIAFFNNKSLILITLLNALKNIFKEYDNEFIEELSLIVSKQMLHPGKLENQEKYIIKNSKLKDIFGTEITYYLDDSQVKVIELLNKRYPNNIDKVNKMIYHLRPSNICYRIK